LSKHRLIVREEKKITRPFVTHARPRRGCKAAPCDSTGSRRAGAPLFLRAFLLLFSLHRAGHRRSRITHNGRTRAFLLARPRLGQASSIRASRGRHKTRQDDHTVSGRVSARARGRSRIRQRDLPVRRANLSPPIIRPDTRRCREATAFTALGPGQIYRGIRVAVDLRYAPFIAARCRANRDRATNRFASPPRYCVANG